MTIFSTASLSILSIILQPSIIAVCSTLSIHSHPTAADAGAMPLGSGCHSVVCNETTELDSGKVCASSKTPASHGNRGAFFMS